MTDTMAPLPDTRITAHVIPFDLGRHAAWCVTWLERDEEARQTKNWIVGFTNAEDAGAFVVALHDDARARGIARSCIQLMSVSSEPDWDWKNAQDHDEDGLRTEVSESWQMGQTVTGPFGGMA